MIKVFTVPVFDPDDEIDELNKFLNSHSIIRIREEFNPSVSNGYWTFCVEYLQSGIKNNSKSKKEKID